MSLPMTTTVNFKTKTKTNTKTKTKTKTKTIIKRPNMCYIFEKLGIPEYQI